MLQRVRRRWRSDCSDGVDCCCDCGGGEIGTAIAVSVVAVTAANSLGHSECAAATMRAFHDVHGPFLP